ncbi:MAG: carbohydrate-binding domain-containing protein [Lachnospiraceae bacterium]|nr:carbohydrate-binding domain-containing protein [Lachnospiraceae bacterium]
MKQFARKCLSLLLALSLVVSAMPAHVKAEPAVSYDLLIADRQITSDHLSGLIRDSFSYRYDPAENVLHLQGTYEATDDDPDYVIWNMGIPGLTIMMDHHVSLGAPDGMQMTFMRISADTTITAAPGSSYGLSIYGTDGTSRTTGIFIGGNSQLTVRDMNLFIGRGATYAIDGGSGSSTLAFRNATANLRATAAAIYRVQGGVQMIDSCFVRPFHARYESGTLMDGSTAALVAQIATGPYPIAVDGMTVTVGNKDNILGDANASVSFDPDELTLYIDGGFTGSNNAPLIENYIDGLTVMVRDDASLTNTSAASGLAGAIVSSGSMTIRGFGAETVLTVDGGPQYYPGVKMLGDSMLTIRDVTLKIRNAGYGLAGDWESGAQSRLAVECAGLDTLDNVRNAGIYGFGGGIVNMGGSSFVAPAYPAVQNGTVRIHTWQADANGDYYRDVPGVLIAPEEQVYDLVIDGTRVWDGNLNSLPGGFAFDPATNVLTAPAAYTQQAATLQTLATYRERPVIDSTIDGLTLRLTGDTTLLSGLENYDTFVPVIRSRGALTILAEEPLEEPVLTLGSTGSAITFDGIRAAGALTLRNISLQIDGAGNGLAGDGTEGSSLLFDGASARILATAGPEGSAAVAGFAGGIEFANGSLFDRPSFSIWEGAVYEQGSVARGVMVITGAYPLYIDGYVVHDGHLSHMGGSVVYDPETNTLTLGAATGVFASETLPYIDNYIEGLTILVNKSTHLTTTCEEEGRAFIRTNADMTIRSRSSETGAYRLNLLTRARNTDGIEARNGAVLTLDGADILVRNAEGGASPRYGIQGGDGASLTVNSSWLEVQNASAVAVAGFGGGITLSGSLLFEPDGGSWSDGFIRRPDGDGAKTVVIRPGTLTGYGVWLGSAQVTNVNQNDILGNGKASYDPDTHTLTISGDLDDVPGSHALEEGHDAKICTDGQDLTVVLEGNLTLSGAAHGIYLPDTDGANLTIEGPGTLTVRSSGICIKSFRDASISADLDLVSEAAGGVSVKGTLLVNGSTGTIKACGTGLSAKNVTIQNADLSIDANDGTQTNVCYAVLATLDMNIKSGTVITGSSGYGLHANGNLSIESGAKVDIEAVHRGIVSQNYSVYLNGNVKVKVSGNSAHGVAAYNGAIKVYGGIIDVYAPTGFSYAFLARGNSTMGNIVIPASHVITVPAQGQVVAVNYHNDHYYSIGTPGDSNSGRHVVIEPNTSYQVWVLDTQVTTQNRTDVLGDGTVSYDPATSTLTLNDANLEGYQLKGGVGYSVIYAGIDLTVAGSGRIVNTATEAGESRAGVRTDYFKSLTLDGDFYICVDGRVRGFATYIVYGGDVTFAGGTITLEGVGTYAVDSYNNISITGGDLTVRSRTETGSGTSFTGDGLCADKETVISGGTVTIDADEHAIVAVKSFRMSGGHVKVEKGDFLVNHSGSEPTEVTITGGLLDAKSFWFSHTGILTVDGDGHLRASGRTAESPAIRGSGLDQIVLGSGHHIFQPAGGHIGNYGGGKNILDNRGNVAGKVEIAPEAYGAEISYELWVLGTQVTYMNREDVLGDGTVSFDPETSTLTLHDANLTGYMVDADGRHTVITSGIDLTVAGTGSIYNASNTIDARRGVIRCTDTSNGLILNGNIHIGMCAPGVGAGGESLGTSYGVLARSVTFAGGNVTMEGHWDDAVSAEAVIAAGGVLTVRSLPGEGVAARGMYAVGYENRGGTVTVDAAGGAFHVNIFFMTAGNVYVANGALVVWTPEPGVERYSPGMHLIGGVLKARDILVTHIDLEGAEEPLSLRPGIRARYAAAAGLAGRGVFTQDESPIAGPVFEPVPGGYPDIVIDGSAFLRAEGSPAISGADSFYLAPTHRVYTPAGGSVGTSDVFGETVLDADGAPAAVVEIGPAPDISHSVSFGSSLQLNYYVWAKPLLEFGYTNIRLEGTRDRWVQGRTEPVPENVVLAEWGESAVGSGPTDVEYRFVYPDIAAKEAGDQLRLRLLADRDGVTCVFAEDSYCVADYAYSRLEKSSNVYFKSMVADLLYFCADAQTFFGYNTANLVTDRMTDAYAAYATPREYAPALTDHSREIELAGATARWTGKSAVFNSNTQLKYYFKLDEGQSTENVALRLTYTTVSGTSVNMTVPLSVCQYAASTGEYAYTYDGLAAKDMRAIVRTQILDGDTPISNMLEYSLESYAARRVANSTNAAMVELVKSMMRFGLSAEYYFTGQLPER